MGGWIESGNYTPKKYGVEKGSKPGLTAGAGKEPDQLRALTGVIGSLKSGGRDLARNRKVEGRKKK